MKQPPMTPNNYSVFLQATLAYRDIKAATEQLVPYLQAREQQGRLLYGSDVCSPIACANDELFS